MSPLVVAARKFAEAELAATLPSHGFEYVVPGAHEDGIGNSRISDDAGERDGPDHGRNDRHGLHFGLFGGYVLKLSCNQPGEAQEAFRGGLPRLGARARQFAPECCNDATGRRLVPVTAGYIFADQQR